jgi:transposase
VILLDARGGRSAPRAPRGFRILIDRLLEHLQLLHRQVEEIEAQIKAWHRTNEASRRLEKVPGVGPLTATALVATVGDAKNFDNGRHFKRVQSISRPTGGRGQSGLRPATVRAAQQQIMTLRQADTAAAAKLPRHSR